MEETSILSCSASCSKHKDDESLRSKHETCANGSSNGSSNGSVSEATKCCRSVDENEQSADHHVYSMKQVRWDRAGGTEPVGQSRWDRAVGTEPLGQSR